jgi:5'-phosphate synthase pdxT subunit
MNAVPTVGVLALQGDVREHLEAIEQLGARAHGIRRAAELDDIDGLIIPGGESTTISKLLDTFDLRGPLEKRLAEGLPAYGSCAGMIMLATKILDGRPDQKPLNAIEITVRRNAFGRQVDSFEGALEVTGIEGPVPGVFIRAPWVEDVGPDVDVLAWIGKHPVAVRQGSVFATSFHPEISGDYRVHRYFLEIVKSTL